MDFAYVATNFSKYNFIIVSPYITIDTTLYGGCIFIAGANADSDKLRFTISSKDTDITIGENVNTQIIIKSIRGFI